MKKLFLVCLLLAAPLHAQTLPPSPQSLTTQFSSACTAVSCATWQMSAQPNTFAAITISVTGTFTGTLDFEGSVDNQTFVSISVTKLSDGSSTTSTTTTGQFAIANSGFQAIRVKATALSAGGPNIWAVRGGGVPKGLSPFLTRLYTGDGTCPLPAWSFAADTNLGVYRVGSDNLAFCANSANLLDISTTRIISTVPILAPDGTAAAPSQSFASEPTTGWYRPSASILAASVAGAKRFGIINNGVFVDDALCFGWSTDPGVDVADLTLCRGAADIIEQRRGTNAQTERLYGYVSGARATYEGMTCSTVAVTLSGATTATSNFIPAGATVESVATSTTTTITNASGYQVGDGSDADRWGDITGTAVGTVSSSTNYTADPRWWTAAARAITLTAKTANFTGGVVQVMACWRSATGT